MLGYYFPIGHGWIIAPEQDRNNSFADFIVLKVQRRYPGDRGVVDHTVAEAKKKADHLNAAMDQLENALEESKRNLCGVGQLSFTALILCSMSITSIFLRTAG